MGADDAEPHIVGKRTEIGDVVVEAFQLKEYGAEHSVGLNDVDAAGGATRSG